MARTRLLLGIGIEIVDPGAHAHIRDRCLIQVPLGRMLLHDLEVDFVFHPSERHQIVFRIHEHGVPQRLSLVRKQE